MNRFSIVQVIAGAVGLAFCCLMLGAAPAENAPPAERALRVGTFEPRAVALAYFRSKLHMDRLATAVAEHKKAKEAGDKQKAKQIEADRNNEQEDAHRQAFGTGPYDSLAEYLAPIWPQVAKAQNVDLIVPKIYFAPAGTQTIDVTEEILTQLGADEKTRKIIDDMRQKIQSGQYNPQDYRGEK